MRTINIKKATLSLILASTVVLANEDLFDKSFEEIMQMKGELKADVGSRSGAKNFLDSRSPVDVITAKQIDHSGLTSLTNILRYFVAGFNAPEPSVTDGSDHVRAFTLRGMNPDQVLVLINGKRLHTSALLHVNGTVGRGTSNVDLDTIAIKAIDKIEILRDGAAAQYGSDAISGVINIILKGMGENSSVDLHTGVRKEGDGEVLYADTFIALPLKYDGFVNLTLSAKEQKQTQRAGADRRLTPPSVQTHFGIPDYKSYNTLLNAEITEIDDITIYANALINYKDSEASAFFRPYDVDDSKYSIDAKTKYPNGFLPMINAKILDYSIIGGAKGQFEDLTTWDISNRYGFSHFHYFVNNSMNYSLGASSPTSFDNGSLTLVQNTTNLDLKKKINKLDLAYGAEYRYENYKIEAGDLESYTNNDNAEKSGSQGFSGFRPEDETDSNRESYALYLDATYMFTKELSLEAAIRYEDFSDFGDTNNFKLSSAYKATSELLVRASASTGFKAPSLAQSNYSQTSTFTDSNSFLSSQGTFRTDHEVAQILGAIPLKAEKSEHFTIGSVYQPSKNTSLMIDYFLTKVDNKILLSDTIKGSTAEQNATLEANNVVAARFFSNAIDTITDGVDVKFNYRKSFENSSKLDFSVWYNYSRNRVVAFNKSTITRENSSDRIDLLENGQPKTSLKILTYYEIDKFETTLNLNRFGSYNHLYKDITYTFKESWTADLDVTYKLNKDIDLAIGGINIFDVMPSKWEGLSGIGYGYDGILPYSQYSPIGHSGAYYYARASIQF